MKKGTIVLICAFVIIVFTLGVAYICLKLYPSEEHTVLSNIEVSLKDKGKGVDVGSLYPYTDTEAKELEPYEFEIINNGDSDVMYQVLIEEVELSDKKGYSKSDLLSRSQLRYELTLNEKVIARDDMSSIDNNILDERTVVASKKNKYKLKVWIAKSASKTKWMNKYYHYKLNIKQVTKGE